MSVRRDSPVSRTYLSVSPGKLISATVPGDATPPALRYDDVTAHWQASNNGTIFFDIGSGGGFSGSFTKVVETLSISLSAEISHSLPGGHSYTMDAGGKLDIFLNGQLLTHDQGVNTYDYVEISTTTIKFHFDVAKLATITYIIK